MNLPDEKREELSAHLFGAATSREVFASPFAAGGYAKWSEGIADALAPLLAGWLAEARTEALREAADAWTQGQWSEVMLPKPAPPAVPVIAYANRVGDWLRDRAALDADAAETTGGGE